MIISVRQPKTSVEFKHYYNLRWRRLRAPWGQVEGSEIDDIEDQCFHIMAITDAQRVVGVARLQFNKDSTAQIRYMAVEDKFERQNIGRRMLAELEQHAQDKGYNNIVLDARETAIDFYRRLGYKITQKSYLLFDEIQHYSMEKRLV